LAKRGEGRFSEQYVYSIMDPSVTINLARIRLGISCDRRGSVIRRRHLSILKWTGYRFVGSYRVSVASTKASIF